MSPMMKALLAACLGLALSGCAGDEDKRIYEPPPPEGAMLEGVLRMPDGKPAAGATVRFFPVDHMPGPENVAKRSAQDLAYSTRTDAEGRYSVDSLPKGEYNLIAGKDGLVSLEDSVFLAPGVHTEISGSLAVAGAVTARVEIQPHHETRAVTVQVLGTSVFSNVDEAGRFTLGGMAPGRYRLRIETAEEGYTTLFTSVAVRSGAADTLEAPLRPGYLGIPVVTGIRVSLDTLAGLARISWNRVDYKRLKHYVVSRGPRGALVPMRETVGVTTDTTFVDDLFGFRDGFGPPLPAGELEYEVRVRNLSDDPGPIFGTATLAVAPPASVTTRLDMERLGTDNGEASLHDTVPVVVRFQNPGRNLVSVSWREDGAEDPVREVRLRPGTRAGTDTLRLVEHAPARHSGIVQVWDDAGVATTARFTVLHSRILPIAEAGSAVKAVAGDTVKLTGTGATRFGSIERMEWRADGWPDWRPSPDGSIQVVMLDSVDHMVCRFRVYNSDGETAMDSVQVMRDIAWQRVGEVPFGGNLGTLVPFRGRVWMIGGQTVPGQSSTVYSSEDGSVWRPEQDRPSLTGRKGSAIFVFQDTLWIIGGEDAVAERHDIWCSANGTDWVEAGRLPSNRPIVPSALYFHGKLRLFAKSAAYYYESVDGKTWLEKRAPSVLENHAVSYAGYDGISVVLGMNAESTGEFILFHSTNLEDWYWVEPRRDVAQRVGPTCFWDGGRFWLFGGTHPKLPEGETRVVVSLDGRKWEPFPFPQSLHKAPATAQYLGRIWVVDEGILFKSF